ncbi:unnamed protein product [Acanthosepion pharaonis]|uniref:Uncharacterized protein n=1 Tax=Acanthosepion pharaonis TaxID=158019 RepID=A0A812DRY5_ACAPH|nr:unnamed protein product [Sepia pharaonis]
MRFLRILPAVCPRSRDHSRAGREHRVGESSTTRPRIRSSSSLAKKYLGSSCYRVCRRGAAIAAKAPKERRAFRPRIWGEGNAARLVGPFYSSPAGGGPAKLVEGVTGSEDVPNSPAGHLRQAFRACHLPLQGRNEPRHAGLYLARNAAIAFRNSNRSSPRRSGHHPRDWLTGTRLSSLPCTRSAAGSSWKRAPKRGDTAR